VRAPPSLNRFSMTGQSDADEVAELQALFASGSPTRESQLPVGAYAKFTSHFENAMTAKEVREKQAAWKEQRQNDVEARRRKRQQHVRAEAETVQKIKDNQEAIRARKMQAKREQRELEAKWEEQRVERARKFAEQGRVRVLEAKALDAKLDKQEEEVDAMEREEAKKAKAERLNRAAELKKQAMAYNKALAEQIRQGDIAILQNKSKREEEKRHKLQGNRSNELSMLKSMKQQNEEKYHNKAGAAKSQAQAIRERARQEREAMMKEKATHARHERSNDHLVQDEKKRVLAEKRRKAAAVYHERYANAKAAAFVQHQVQNSSFYLLDRSAGVPDPGMPGSG